MESQVFDFFDLVPDPWNTLLCTEAREQVLAVGYSTERKMKRTTSSPRYLGTYLSRYSSKPASIILLLAWTLCTLNPAWPSKLLHCERLLSLPPITSMLRSRSTFPASGARSGSTSSQISSRECGWPLIAGTRFSRIFTQAASGQSCKIDRRK